MKKMIASIVIVSFLGVAGCTNMSRTQQGAVSGGAVGAGVGAGISLLTGGGLVTGALLGGALGAVGGGIYGDSKEEK
jgi:hypothetical protein